MKAQLHKFLQLTNKCTLLPLFQPRPQQTVLVDFSSPNIAKPFHLGHFRATVTGNFIRNINEAMNHKVVAISYMGDWGTQFNVLSKAFARYGSMEKLRTDPLKHLQEIYVRANRDQPASQQLTVPNQNTSVTDLDHEQLEWWRHVRQLTMEHLTRTYERMNVRFTAFEYESDYVDAAKRLVEHLLSSGLAVHDADGVVSFHVTDPSKSDSRIVLLKSNTSTLYLTRDLAAALSRYERYRFDRIHYVVEGAQRLHFQHLCTVLRHLDCPWLVSQISENSHASSSIHVPFGRVQGASTRHGQGLTLSDILNNARMAIVRRMERSLTTRVPLTDVSPSDPQMTTTLDVADQLGVTCLVIEMLRKRRQKPIRLHSFLGSPVVRQPASTDSDEDDQGHDASEELRDQSDLSGMGLQYCYARLCSLETRTIQLGILQADLSSPDSHDADHLCNRLPNSIWESTSQSAVFHDLYDHLLRFESAVESAYLDYEASVLVQYATRLMTKINVAWKQLPVITCTDEKEKILRLVLFLAARNVLGTCLRLLGIQPLRSI